MFSFTGKTILIISQQSWGKMFVSKHHYAAELARQGNKVYFLNPPNYQHRDFKEMIEIVPSEFHPNIFLINDNLLFPFNIKFHFLALFHILIRRHVKEILRKIDSPVDVVWSFDLAHVYPLWFFPKKALKLFHPVDDPMLPSGISAAKGAQYIFSTADEILKKYPQYNVPKKFINHGIADEFLSAKKEIKTDSITRIGFSGNLLREDIHRDTLLKIISDNNTLIFECWGSYENKDANVGGIKDEKTAKFIDELKSHANVILHGVVPAKLLAAELQRMDAFLICYDLTSEVRVGPNYHKLLEYISTGKITVSNYVSVYKDMPVLVQMTGEHVTMPELATLFKEVIDNLALHNSPGKQAQRIEFAKDNTYFKQIKRIEEFINSNPN